jgi:hypothetical protein
MIVIGIDPGPIEHAVVAYDVKANHVMFAKDMTTEGIWNLPSQFAIDEKTVFAIEWFECFGKPAGQTMFMTIFEIGRIASILPTRLIFRRHVKQFLCDDSRAGDSNVRQALIDKVGAPGTKKEPGPTYGISKHLWQSLAVAVYAANVQPHSGEFQPLPFTLPEWVTNGGRYAS